MFGSLQSNNGITARIKSILSAAIRTRSDFAAIIGPIACVLVALLAMFTAWLAWRSLNWPLIGDATVFHFITSQMMLGAAPYRDLIDMNMPMIYAIHTAVIALGGMGDYTFRIFDFTLSLLIGSLAAALVWPAGRALALLAALATVLMHLMFGPLAAGQRDYILLIPMLVVATLSVRIAEGRGARTEQLLAIGALCALASLLKPTGVLLALTPFVVGRFQVRDGVLVLIGGAAIGLASGAVLLAMGALEPFLDVLGTYVPMYAAIDRLSLEDLLAKVASFILPLAGFVLAAVATLNGPQSARARIMIWLTAFGLLHFIMQRKGYFYHAYPLIVALICWGALSVRKLNLRVGIVALALIGFFLGLRAKSTVGQVYSLAPDAMASVVSRSMERALSARLPRGARVETLDVGGTAFLAMARAGMRQATPHAYWIFLIGGPKQWRDAFLQQLSSDPPDAVLLTSSMWLVKDRAQLDAQWPELKALLESCFELVENHAVTSSSHPWAGTSPSWQLYVRSGARKRDCSVAT